jgi:hypothetical protein
MNVACPLADAAGWWDRALGLARTLALFVRNAGYLRVLHRNECQVVELAGVL